MGGEEEKGREESPSTVDWMYAPGDEWLDENLGTCILVGAATAMALGFGVGLTRARSVAEGTFGGMFSLAEKSSKGKTALTTPKNLSQGKTRMKNPIINPRNKADPNEWYAENPQAVAAAALGGATCITIGFAGLAYLGVKVATGVDSVSGTSEIIASHLIFAIASFQTSRLDCPGQGENSMTQYNDHSGASLLRRLK
jgi:hypothetical protein